MPMTPMKRLDSREITKNAGEIRAFVTVLNEEKRLACFLDHYRSLGVNRFFFADNLSKDGTVKYLLAQPDCHVFSAPGNHFTENVEPPRWLNALLNVFGNGHWCVTVDADELLVFPNFTTVSLKEFCGYLDQEGSQALAGPMIDMYGPGPVAATRYIQGTHFLDSCPYFDPELGWSRRTEYCPGWQLFGGARERVFWHDQPKENLPPCISKVPLVKWRKGLDYIVAEHLHKGAKVSPMRGALLHFKFLSGFAISNKDQVTINKHVAEKTLSEKAIYLAALAKDPSLSLMYQHSTLYTGPEQLEKLGWMVATPHYKRFASQLKRKTQKK